MRKTYSCLCGTCLTHQENSESGFCINGHDNWIEPADVGHFIYSRTRPVMCGEDHVNTTYPHIPAMFKSLARKLGMKLDELFTVLAKNPRYLFTKNFV